MYLDVVNPPSPLPSVRGLTVELPIPQLIRGRGFGGYRRGLGQGSGCTYGGLAAAMQDWLSSLANEPAEVAAVGCGQGGGAPCPDPITASQQQAAAIAADYCQTDASNAAEFGCPADPACANPAGAIQSFITQAQALFNNYPPSVWGAEAAAGASGQYYNEVPSCPPNTSPSTSGGVTVCYSLTTGVAEPATYAPAPVQGSPQGPVLNIMPGVASSTTPATQPASPTVIAIPSPSSIAANNAATVQTTQAPSASPTVIQVPSSVSSTPSSSGIDLSFLTNDLVPLPLWGWLAGGAVLLFLLGGKR
jgi:hypothetical protein